MKGDISDSQLNAGECHFGPFLYISEGVLWDTILLKHVLKPIWFMILCKYWGQYQKNLLRYGYLKILRLWDLLVPWATKIAQILRWTDLVLFFLTLKMMFNNLNSTSDSYNFHIFSTPSEGGWGEKSELEFCQIFCFLYLGKVKKFQNFTCTRLKVRDNIWKGGPKWPPSPWIGLRFFLVA